MRAGAVSGTAKLVGKSTAYTIKEFVVSDKTNDLALLRVTEDGIKPLSLGSSSDVKIGETVYVAGNPIGLEGTFSDGIISSKRDMGGQEPYLQMTAPVSQGSSGGPVLNRKGEVIGVAVGSLEDGQNLNFAIPSRGLKILVSVVYMGWGQGKLELDDYAGAIADFDMATRMSPDNPIGYMIRGQAKLRFGTSKIIDYLQFLLTCCDILNTEVTDFLEAALPDGVSLDQVNAMLDETNAMLEKFNISAACSLDAEQDVLTYLKLVEEKKDLLEIGKKALRVILDTKRMDESRKETLNFLHEKLQAKKEELSPATIPGKTL